MIFDYDNFINEAKMSEIKVGDKVAFKGKISIPGNGYEPVDVNGITGVIKDIKKDYYSSKITFLLDKPINHRYNNKKLKEITLSSYQLRNVQITDEEYLKNRSEQEKKISSGEIAKYQATKDFLWIMKQIKFTKKGEYFDASYFDIVKDNLDYISFVPSKKSIGDDFEKFRQNTRAGRVFRKLNPDLTEKEIEDFVNKYRAEVESYLSEPMVNVVTGKDISYWYNQKMYQKGGGTLNNSCMRGAGAQTQVKFYDNFPDKIALATYIKGGKLWARALVWRLDDGRVYMDRIYSVTQPAAIQLEKYAEDHNMLMYKNRYKTAKQTKMTVTLKDGANWKNPKPYFDTFGFNYRVEKNDAVLTGVY